MARRAKPNDSDSNGVTNLTETKQVIQEAVGKILRLRSERKELNEAIGEQRARVKNNGIPPAALDLAIRMKEADAEDRQKHDEGYAIARDALGLGLQRSLFEQLDERMDTEARSPKRHAKAPSEPYEGDNSDLAGADDAGPNMAAIDSARAHLSGVPSSDARN